MPARKADWTARRVGKAPDVIYRCVAPETPAYRCRIASHSAPFRPADAGRGAIAFHDRSAE